MPMPKTRQVAGRRIFISYCHADYADALNLHMELEAMCRRLGDTAVFLDSRGDSQLMAGDRWKERIAEALDTADVFLVLMSTPFIASEFCRDVELRRMLERSTREHRVRVIGIALHQLNLANFFVDVDGVRVSLEDRQCLPQDQVDTAIGPRLGLKPISLWPDSRKRDAWHVVVAQIETALCADGTPASAAAAQGEAPAALAAAVPAGPALATSWLPYLCNRSDQFDALLVRLGEWQGRGFRRPLVAVTEGRPEDCLAKWVERMRLKEIARCLGFDHTGLSFGHFKPLAWPSNAVRLSSPADARQRFVRALATALGPRPLATESEIRDAFLYRAQPTLLWVDCLEVSDAGQAGLAFGGLLGVLADWPDLNQHALLVVAINVVRAAGTAAGERSRLAQMFDAAIAAAVQVEGAVLGSLPELDELAIYDWSMHDDVQGKLAEDMEVLLSRLPQDRATWSMRTFAEKARDWIRAA